MLTIVSSICEKTKEIQYTVAPQIWVNRKKNLFSYPPETVPEKARLKLVKANKAAPDSWPKFQIRKIHYVNISM